MVAGTASSCSCCSGIHILPAICRIDHSEVHSAEASAPRPGKQRALRARGSRNSFPAERYDVIVFSRSICLSRPADVLQRYMSALNKDGVMIVSMLSRICAGSGHLRLLESVAEILHSTAVTKPKTISPGMFACCGRLNRHGSRKRLPRGWALFSLPRSSQLLLAIWTTPTGSANTKVEQQEYRQLQAEKAFDSGLPRSSALCGGE